MDATAGGLDEPRERAQGGGLAASGRTQEGEELTLLDLQIEVRDRTVVAEHDLDVVETDHRLLSLPVRDCAGQPMYSSVTFSTQAPRFSLTKPKSMS